MKVIGPFKFARAKFYCTLLSAEFILYSVNKKCWWGEHDATDLWTFLASAINLALLKKVPFSSSVPFSLWTEFPISQSFQTHFSFQSTLWDFGRPRDRTASLLIMLQDCCNSIGSMLWEFARWTLRVEFQSLFILWQNWFHSTKFLQWRSWELKFHLCFSCCSIWFHSINLLLW